LKPFRSSAASPETTYKSQQFLTPRCSITRFSLSLPSGLSSFLKSTFDPHSGTCTVSLMVFFVGVSLPQERSQFPLFLLIPVLQRTFTGCVFTAALVTHLNSCSRACARPLSSFSNQGTSDSTVPLWRGQAPPFRVRLTCPSGSDAPCPLFSLPELYIFHLVL